MKPSIPKGTRDFGPQEMLRRRYILDTVRRNFELFAYEPIETPAMENIATLTGKYGDEGDQLIFKILNSRIHESADKETLKKEFELSLQSARNTPVLTERALRYDLTVPFARFVVMNQHKLTFPFRRYQIQPVWRADKPQKGRYREFCQCDADVIGSTSLVNELELISLMDRSFSELKIPVTLKINNRKLLSAIAGIIGEPEKIVPITVAIDKLEKIGREGVNSELQNAGLSVSAIESLQPLLDLRGSNAEKLKLLEAFFGAEETGKKGMQELSFLLDNALVSHLRLEFDITLARGLSYYTGTIFEAKADAGTFSPSILGGGRYDDLTGIFGLKNMSGVGISFGIDRIYDVMEELALFPENAMSGAQLMFAHFDEISQMHCLQLASQLRSEGVSCEVYPDAGKKPGKQFEYANKKGIRFVCAVGSDEMESGHYALKDMRTGEQIMLNVADLIRRIKNA